MVPCGITPKSVLEPGRPGPVDPPGVSMLGYPNVVEGTRAPTQHICADFVNSVPAWSLQKRVNLLPAGGSVDLGGAANVEGGVIWRIFLEASLIYGIDDPAADAEARV